jgi:hypothetical protein
VGRGAEEFWFGLSAGTRRRLLLALGVIAMLAVVWLVAIPALPCQAPGGDTCAPSDDAIVLVPDDALAYLHLNLDPDTDQFRAAERISARVPSLTGQGVDRLLLQLPGPRGSAPDFARDVQPWFGGEAALAVIPAARGGAQEVVLLEARDEAGAREFAAPVGSRRSQRTTYRDVEVQVDRRGLATALVGGFLAIGTQSGVRAVIDARIGAKGTGALADDRAASAARDALPDKRLADLYLSRAGVARLVASPAGPLATFASLINPGASQSAAAALVAGDDGLDLDIRSELDSPRAQTHPGFFEAFPSFTPTLGSKLPPDSLGYVGIADPGTTLGSLLQQARRSEPGLAAAIGRLAKQATKLGKANLQGDLVPLLGGEAAFALEPLSPGTGSAGPAGASPPASAAGASALGAPSRSAFVTFVGTVVDGSAAAQVLERLQGPIARALDRSKHAAGFAEHEVGDVTTHSLRLSTSVNLTYALVGSTLAIASRPIGVEQLAAGEGGLDGAGLFDQATAGLPERVSLLGYLNLEGLIALGEQAGLAEDPAYATFAADIRKLKALGLAVQSSPDELATDLRLVIGEGPGEGAATGEAPSE